MIPSRELYCTRSTDCTNTVDGDTWNLTLNMEKYPTKPEEVKVKVENGVLQLSGKSQTQKEENGYKKSQTQKEEN